MKKINAIRLIARLFLLSVFFISCNSNRGEKTNRKVIAIVIPVTIDAFDELISGVKDRIDSNFLVKVYSAEADPGKFETVVQSALLTNPDYLITVGTQITNTAFGPRFEKKLPVVIAGAISDASKVEALVKINVTPPRTAAVAIVSDNPKESIYDLFYKTFSTIMPQTKSVGILYNPSEINSKIGVDQLTEILTANSIKVKKGTISSLEDVEKVANALLIDKIGAIIIPHDKFAVTKASSIVKICDQKGIPVFSLDQGTVHKDGVVIGVSVNYRDVGNMIGETIMKIENKREKAEDIPLVSMNKASVYINTAKAKTLGIAIPAEVNNKAIKY